MPASDDPFAQADSALPGPLEAARPDAEPDEIEPGSGEGAEERQAVVPPELHGERLDKVLVWAAPEFSRSHLQGLIRRACVRVQGQVQASPSTRLKSGQRLQVLLEPTAQSLAFRPQALEVPRLFEDEDFMVVNKPAGLVVHPAAGHWQGTLLNGLLHLHAGAAHLPRAGIVHRLDKDTSGLMVVGKTLPAVTALSRAIAAREVKRSYLALAHGAWRLGETSLNAAIGRDPQSRIRMAELPSGKPARTDVQPLEVLGEALPVVSQLLCRLHTGRTHQIRVHLASRGHPLVADALYGGAPALGLQRQALHAWRLELAHPRTSELLRFEAPPPDDFMQAWVGGLPA
jgi:23S rRNA pseudouridine1911/1915/1917 synthase